METNPDTAKTKNRALQFLDSAQTEKDRAHFISQCNKATRHYAKRQFTWFRKEPLFRWLDIEEHPTERIKELTGHLQIHKHDFATRRGLLQMVGQRRRLLRYIAQHDSH